VRVNETGERIPLTIAESDAQAGTVTIIVKALARRRRY